MKKALITSGILIIGVAAVAASALYLFSDSVAQPIAFNHRLHIEDVGAVCTDCHLYAETGIRATIPNVPICGSCHEEPVSGSPDDTLLIEHVQSETAIPWRKVYALPDHVYFSHRRHAGLGEMECAVCHGEIAAQERPITRTVQAVTMDWCMECHWERQVTNDCIACHR